MVRALTATFLLVTTCFGANLGITQQEFKARREALRKEIAEGVVILFGGTERETGNLREAFFQEPNFYYLTGWTEPGAVIVITPKTEILLLPQRVKANEKWTGPKVGPDDPNARAITGFENVMPLEAMESKLAEWLTAAAKVYTLTGTPDAEKLQKLAPLRQLADARNSIARLRMRKSPAEIALVQRSTDASIAGHMAGWKRIKPGVTEYQVANTIASTWFDMGCERNAYAPISGSGGHAAILHYARNRGTLDRGQVALMDMGAECSMYASDITRTVPVDGKFSKRQRELYDIVLGAQKAAIAAVKPGATLSRTAADGLYKVAFDYINTHGKDRNGEPLGKYFTHGLGHHVGLEVHDADDKSPLAAGMIITIEPGIYIPDEGIGIRIEDMVLVTETGAQVMSSKLPREPDEIERAMARP